MFVPLMLYRMCRKNEKELKEELSSLKSHLQRAVEDCERLSDQLEQKVRSTISNRVDSNADIKFENFLFRNWLKNCFLLSIPEN